MDPTRILSKKQIVSIHEATARMNVWDGAIRSGKTLSSLIRFMIDVAAAPRQGEIVVIAKTGHTAARNVFTPLQDAGLFGSHLAGQVKYTPGAPTATVLGRRVWVIGANDARSEQRLRGLTCYLAYCDELSLISQEFFTQLLGRMSVPGAKVLATTNPDNPSHWLRRDYLLRAAKLGLRYWHFTLDDNPSLTAEYLQSIKNEFTGLWYRRYILGEWAAAEGAIFDMWDPGRHVFDVYPAPIVSWPAAAIDYGTTNPFAAVLLGYGADNVLYLTTEWRWDSGARKRQLTDAEYSEKVRTWLNGARIPRTRLSGVTPEFVVVDPSAASFKAQLYSDGLPCVDGDNSVIDGIRVISTLLAQDRLRVHSSCRGFISEVAGYVWDERYKLIGEDRPLKLNDHCLAAGTLIATSMGDIPIEQVHAGDEVMTRTGWRKVTDAWQVSPAAEVIAVRMPGGGKLTGTPEHRVWTGNRGWVRLDALRYADRLVTWPQPRRLSTRESGTGVIPMLAHGLSAPTTFPGSQTGRSPALGACMKRFGRTLTALSRRAVMSITRITTRSTTTLETSCAWMARSISAITHPWRTTPPGNGSHTWSASGLSPWPGTGPPRDANGTASTRSRSWPPASRARPSASSAETATKPPPVAPGSSSARTAAGRRGGAEPASTTNSDPARDARRSSTSTATRRPDTAGSHALLPRDGSTARLPVYDLTVDGAHEFFANGILVHNSVDAARYGIFTTRSLWQSRMAQAM